MYKVELIALDNIEPDLDVDAVLDTLRGGTAVLLLTSRKVVAPTRVQSIPLSPLSDFAADELFRQRLQQADPRRPTDDDIAPTLELVKLLGGLPLAIALVAAYTGIQRLSVQTTITKMRGDGLEFGPLSVVRASFELSWCQLTESQQKLFAVIPGYNGSFPRAAALEMARASLLNVDEAKRNLDTLVSLALVEPLTDEWIRMHPLLEQYRVEKARELGLFGHGIVKNLEITSDEYWDRRYERADLYAAEGNLSKALYWIEQALKVARSAGQPDWERDCLHFRAVINARAGNREKVREDLLEALVVARHMGNVSYQSKELQSLGTHELLVGRVSHARDFLTQALATAQIAPVGEIDDSLLHPSRALLIAEATRWLAELAFIEGDLETSRKRFVEAQEFFAARAQADVSLKHKARRIQKRIEQLQRAE